MIRPGQRGTIEEQRVNLRSSLTGIVELIRRGHSLVITHGNGPQVGQILLRAEEARGKAYDLAGVDAVVDKDLTSSVLANAIGIERIIDLTAVERVKLDFGSPMERDIPSMTVAEARAYLAQGHFAPGSMGPKIEGAIDFLRRGGREVIITLPEKTLDAFDGKAGTHIYPN